MDTIQAKETGRTVVSHLRTKVIALIAGLFAVLTAIVASPAAAESEGPPITPEQRAAALSRPGLVYLQTEWSAYVFDSEGNILNDGDPFELTTTCSAFVVNADGYLATADHCVNPGNQPGGFGYDLVEAVAEDEWTRYGLGAYVSLEQWTEFAHANWKVEGRTKNSPPDRTVTVQHGVARANLKDSEELTARVIDFKPSDEGDLALLKVEQPNLPTLEIAPETERVDVGEPVLAIGYPGSVEDVTDADAGLEPTSKAGSVSSRRTSGGVPVLDVSSPFNKGMSGGPIVDFAGRVIGVISFRPASENEGINFAIDASVLRELLTQNNIDNRLGPLDMTYREGLAQFYAGDHQDALESFSRVLGAVPWHAQAQALKQQATELLATEKASADGGLPRGVVGGAVAVVLILGGLTVVRRKGHKAEEGSARDDVSLDREGAEQAGAAVSPAVGPERPFEHVTTAFPTPSTEAGSSVTELGSVRTLVPPSTPSVCPNCGAPQESRANFCPTCGTRIVQKTA